MAKLLLLDGNSLTYRAFFALPSDMATASGQVTNAVFGFTSMLVNLLKDHQPDAVVVAFDLPLPTFRHEMIDDYKAGREEAPDILRQQMGLVRQVVEGLEFPIVEVPGYEADDIIATIATRAEANGDDVIIVTGDRDVYQLVSDPHIKVLYNRRGVSDYVLYDEAGIFERTGVTPVQYPGYAALRGDPSDNLPGVPGVGEKTAAKLINQYGGLDGIFANVDKATPKLRQNLIEFEERTRKNAEATPLVRDVPLDLDLSGLHLAEWDREKLRQLFNFLEFRSLWDRLLEAWPGEGGQGEGERIGDAEQLEPVIERLDTTKSAVAYLEMLENDVAIAVSWDGREGRSAINGVALTEDGDQVQWIPREIVDSDEVRKALHFLLTRGGRGVVHGHGVKELLRGLSDCDIALDAIGIDTKLAAYLVDPADSQYLLEELALRYARVELLPPDAAPSGQLDLEGTNDEGADATARRAMAIWRLVPTLGDALEKRGLLSLYHDIEKPLIRVLSRMEGIGIRVDEDYLRTLSKELSEEVQRLDAEIQELAGEPFRVNSTPQLRTILFEKLGLTPQKKTKTGYSTDAASLEKLLGQHPIIEKLLRYREVEKLRSTYGESLLQEVGPDSRIHATFNQTVARTGRLSSDQPNLHNIPIRSEEGRRFRRAFIPADDCTFLVADYNQIELRVIAHLAEDPGLIEAFESGADVHTETASRIFDVEPEDVTIAQRSKAKMVSYGLAYGMESYGLAQRLNIPVDEAAVILDAYFEAFPHVGAYMDETVAEARSKGYTETLFGRRRQIPELASSNYRIRQAGERQAMNAGIQGLAADIFKVALVKLDNVLEQQGLQSRLVLQVHDEVLVETLEAERDRVKELTVDAMRTAADLRVPLDVNVSWATNWADAKG